MLVLTQADVLRLMQPPDMIAAVKRAMLALEDDAVSTPERLHTAWRDNTLLTMPAVSSNAIGVKIVSIVPSNAQRNLPVTLGLMVLSSVDTGEPIALLDAGVLTGIRTGAVGAVGLELLTPQDTQSVGVIGCGVQGTWQAVFAASVRPIREIFCLDHKAEAITRFADSVRRHAPHVKVTPCETSSALLDATNVVITATTSSTPVLPNSVDALRGKHFVSIGSYRPHMQELPDAVYDLAGFIAVDSSLALHEVGDVLNAVNRGAASARNVFSIGELLTNKRIVDRNGTTVYKTAGMALFDLFVACDLYDSAHSLNVGQEILL